MAAVRRRVYRPEVTRFSEGIAPRTTQGGHDTAPHTRSSPGVRGGR